MVGATLGAEFPELAGVDLAGFPGPFLVPGVGAQGGSAEDVRRLFGGAFGAVLPAVSREVLRAGPGVGALRDAVRRAADEFVFLRA